MKILAFSFEAPDETYGGGIGIIQSLASLCSFAEITYVGPRFDESHFSSISLAGKFFLEETTFVPVKAANVLRGVTARYYQAWKKAISYINPADYDLAFIDFSYNDFIQRWAKSCKLPTIVRVHNIEQDMSLNSVAGKQHDKYWFRNLLNVNRIIEREARCMKGCDRLLFLTDEDKARAIELYGDELEAKADVVPVCLNMSKTNKGESYNFGTYVLATGSLFYGPNAEGIAWLVNEVWPKVISASQSDDINLVIAGRKPTEALKKAVKNSSRCFLVESPKEMAPLFENASLYLAPIFSGAGMKVKIAEALSYGLCVVGTSHALIGYAEASQALREAQTADEFAEFILEGINNNSLNKADVIAIYESLYTLSRSANDFMKCINNVVLKNKESGSE